MDRAYIDQRQVIERYLRGTLTPDELGEFEIYMLDHPEIVDDVEYARGLGDALMAAKDELLMAGPAVRARPSFFLGPRYALAATVVLALTSALSLHLLQRNSVLTAEMNELGGPSLVPVEVWLENMRGNEPPLIEKAAADPLLLRVAADPRTPGPYDVAIRSSDSGFSWTQSHAFAGDDGALRIVVRNMPAGTYEVTATGAEPIAVRVSYTFRLVVSD